MGDTIEQAARVIAGFATEAVVNGERREIVTLTDIAAHAIAQALSDAGLLAGGWRPISEAKSFERMIVCGWQPRNKNVAGYWWVHEDVADDNGIPIDHPEAVYFQPLPSPPEEGR